MLAGLIFMLYEKVPSFFQEVPKTRVVPIEPVGCEQVSGERAIAWSSQSILMIHIKHTALTCWPYSYSPCVIVWWVMSTKNRSKSSRERRTNDGQPSIGL